MASGKIAVIVHSLKKQSQALLEQLREWAKKHNYRVVTNLDLAENSELLSDAKPLPDETVVEKFAGASWAVTLGGDGTLLYAAHLVAPLNIPVLSVHLGNLGFHTQVEPAGLQRALEAVHRGEYSVENRMLLQVEVQNKAGDAKPVGSALALNDVVVSKSAWGRMVHLRINVDSQPASDLYADGFLVATPTGSSAYNYAARGPILEPKMEAIILNAICPHRLNFSPIVLSADHVVGVEFHPRKPSEEAQLLVDGRTWGSVSDSMQLKIYKASMYVRLIMFENRFFEKLREKLAWGGLFWKVDG
jgi:NAD+ kinase